MPSTVAAAFERLHAIMTRLRAPDGCPWDREQTHASLRGALIEECYEVIDAIERADDANLREELGDLLFSAVNLSRFLHVDPAIALHAANEKFSRRFRQVERRMAESGLPLAAEHMAAMDGFWEEAKAEEKRG